MDTLQYFLLFVILLTLIQPACGMYISSADSRDVC